MNVTLSASTSLTVQAMQLERAQRAAKTPPPQGAERRTRSLQATPNSNSAATIVTISLKQEDESSQSSSNCYAVLN